MTPLQWLDSLQGSGIRPGLVRMRALLRALGGPHREYPSVLVAGTNGKGSTTATLASILLESGYRAGLYTSPHLVDIRERWMIAGSPVDATLLDSSIESLRATAQSCGILPTYFEAMTLVAFIAFERAGCEIAVLETGMGGRLDATNVVRPVAALITPVALDHMEFLGRTVRRIAAEKAGIIHRGAIVLTSSDDPSVLDVLRKRAAKFGCRFIHVTEEHPSPLPGAFQRRNAALAVRAARELASPFDRITEETIASGVASTHWRGRLERIDARGKEIWIDGGHNPNAADAIAPFIDQNVARPRLLVFGIMRDKDVEAVTRRLFPLFDRIITTEPYAPRSAAAADLAADERATAIPDVDEALRVALDSPEQAIVITGSLYLAGAAIDFFDKIAAP